MPAATNRKSKATALAKILVRSGLILFGLGAALLILIYLPVLREEGRYELQKARSRIMGSLSPIQEELTPVDPSFGIVIPKLGANARIIANVDPFNGAEYQRALTKGVAHAKGTSLPGQDGNIFLFSHSSVDFYRATQFNSVFYLLTKMEIRDTIDLYYEGSRYSYSVTAKHIVSASDIQYLDAMGKGRKTLTLMTCWPPGTTLKRLIVIAEHRVDE